MEGDLVVIRMLKPEGCNREETIKEEENVLTATEDIEERLDDDDLQAEEAEISRKRGVVVGVLERRHPTKLIGKIKPLNRNSFFNDRDQYALLYPNDKVCHAAFYFVSFFCFLFWDSWRMDVPSILFVACSCYYLLLEQHLPPFFVRLQDIPTACGPEQWQNDLFAAESRTPVWPADRTNPIARVLTWWTFVHCPFSFWSLC